MSLGFTGKTLDEHAEWLRLEALLARLRLRLI